MLYFQKDQDALAVFVPPKRAASATLAVYSPQGVLLSSPAVTLDPAAGTIASVGDFSFVVSVSAGSLAPGRRYWLTSTVAGSALVEADTTTNAAGEWTVTYEDMPTIAPAVAQTLSGARLTATILAASLATLGTYYQLRWTVTLTTGEVVTYTESSSVCRTVFLPPMTPAIAARHAGYVFPHIANQRGAAYWQDVSDRANRRVEQRMMASGRMPQLVGDPTMLQDAGMVALRLELARDGLIPQGFDASGFTAQLDTELKEQMEWALSSTWIDTDDDGKVGVSELGGPKSIVLVRS